VLGIAVLVGAFFLFAQESAPNGTLSTETPAPEAGNERTIRVTAEGFVPSALTIKKGESVTWMNETDRNVWPASAMHPTHMVYPGSDIKKCDTAEAATIFDSCAGITPGSSWSFVFNEVGTWKYHDHLRATVFGSITVQ